MASLYNQDIAKYIGYPFLLKSGAWLYARNGLREVQGKLAPSELSALASIEVRGISFSSVMQSREIRLLFFQFPQRLPDM